MEMTEQEEHEIRQYVESQTSDRENEVQLVQRVGRRRAQAPVVLRCHKAKPFSQVDGLPLQLPASNAVFQRGPGDR